MSSFLKLDIGTGVRVEKKYTVQCVLVAFSHNLGVGENMNPIHVLDSVLHDFVAFSLNPQNNSRK